MTGFSEATSGYLATGGNSIRGTERGNLYHVVQIGIIGISLNMSSMKLFYIVSVTSDGKITYLHLKNSWDKVK